MRTATSRGAVVEAGDARWPPGVVRAGARQVEVVVVDGDDVNRRGMASLLAACAGIGPVTELTCGEALEFTERWRQAGVVLIDAGDERSRPDPFPGVTVVEWVHRHRSQDRTAIVAVTGHYLNDAVRRRMDEAGADYLYPRHEFADAGVLCQAVLDPPAARRVPPPGCPEVLLCYGVSDLTRVNRAVAYAVEHGLFETLRQRPPLSRRAWVRVRREFNREANLTPMTADGCLPDRTQELPSLPQIERFLAWATDDAGAAAGPGAVDRQVDGAALRAVAALGQGRPDRSVTRGRDRTVR